MFDNALHLTRKDFDIKNNVVYVNKHFNDMDGSVMVYAPWCPHCQMKDKSISKMADYMKKNNENYKVAVVDGNTPDMKDVLTALKCEGYPTFYHVTNTDKGSEMLSFGDADKKLLDMFLKE